MSSPFAPFRPEVANLFMDVSGLDVSAAGSAPAAPAGQPASAAEKPPAPPSAADPRRKRMYRELEDTYALDAAGLTPEDFTVTGEGFFIDNALPPPGMLKYRPTSALLTAVLEDVPALLGHTPAEVSYQITKNGHPLDVGRGTRRWQPSRNPERTLRQWADGLGSHSPEMSPLSVRLQSAVHHDEVSLRLSADLNDNDGPFQLSAETKPGRYEWLATNLGAFTSNAVYYEGAATVRVGFFPTSRPKPEEREFYVPSQFARMQKLAVPLELPLSRVADHISRVFSMHYISASAIASGMKSDPSWTDHIVLEPILRQTLTEDSFAASTLDTWVAVADTQERGDLSVPVLYSTFPITWPSQTTVRKVIAAYRHLRRESAHPFSAPDNGTVSERRSHYRHVAYPILPRGAEAIGTPNHS